jgi:O-antigen ligase
MMQLIGTAVCMAIIGWLFYLDRDAEEQPSAALWIPTVWMLINASRGVSSWMHRSSTVTLAQQYTDGSPVDAAVFAVLIVAGAVVLNSRSHQVRAFFRANLPLLVFFGYCALSVLWSEQPFIAFKRWSKSVGDLIMIMIVLTDAQPLAATRRLFTRVGFVLLPLSVLFIKCYPDLGSAYSIEDERMMYFGVTTFKNLLGMISMVFGLASLWSLLGAYDRRDLAHRTSHLIAHAVLIVTAVWLIVTADSMTSLSCFALAGAVMVLVSQSWIQRWNKGVYIAVSGALAVPLFALFLDTVGTLVHSLGRNATLTGRTSIWKAVLSMNTNPLIGTGFESFWLGDRLERVWNMSVHGIQEAHNGYIEIYLNLGWVGLVLLGWLIISGFKNANTALHRNVHDGRLKFAYLTAGLIFSITEAGFRMLGPIWLAFLLAVACSPAPAYCSEHGRSAQMLWRRAFMPKHVRILR